MIHKKEGTLVLSFLCPCRVGKTRSLLKQQPPVQQKLKTHDFVHTTNKHRRYTCGIIKNVRWNCMSTILIADDEARIRRLVSDFLKRDGHTIVEAADGKEALNILENRRPGLDMAILDVMMPGMDGFEVLRELREQEHGETHLPVMLLTARAEDADQVRGLEGGADDYVTKPFSPIVLAARVRTLLKREGRVGAPLEQLGKLSVNELRREVMVENKPIDLTPKEYELLIYFKNNRAIALSRESILNAVWGYDYFGDLRTVDTHVKKLRAKLGECGTMIETVRGYGYRFEV